MNNLIADFIVEMREMLDAISDALHTFESDPSDHRPLDEIGRLLHTVKGNSFCFDLSRIGIVAHEAEDAVARMRTRRLDTRSASTLRAPVARLGALLDELEREEGSIGGENPTGVLASLKSLVGNLSERAGKPVSLEIDGSDINVGPEATSLLRSAIVEIVRNAISHGIEDEQDRHRAGKPATGRLRVAVSHEAGQTLIDVEDDGRGLDIEALCRRATASGMIGSDTAVQLSAQQKGALVFMPGLSTANEVTALSGRGIGMDVVRRNIERIGGSIHLANRLGQGLRLTIQIPHAAHLEPVADPPCFGESTGRPSRTCLVVDDSRVIRKVARHLLETLHFRVEEAGDGDEALACCRSGPPDLVLVDLNMPKMGGILFLHALRRQPLRRQPKVLLCGAEDEEAGTCAALQAGADEFVAKPFDRATLESKLRSIAFH